MILSIFDKNPQILQAAFLAGSASVIGDVVAEEGSSIWYGAVLRADTAAIRIGRGANIQDNAVLHTGPGLDVVLGENVTVGHSAVVHGCTVGSGTLVGMHATLMNGCRIGKDCIIGAGALVPGGMEVPDGCLAVGVPAKVRGPASPQQIADSLANARRYQKLAAAHAAAQRTAAALPPFQNL